MKRFHSVLLLVLAGLLMLSACKKDKDKEPSKTDLLTSHAWKDSQVTLQLNAYTGTTTASNPSSYQFERDGRYTVTPTSGGTTTTGTWSFASNETQLVLSTGSNTQTLELFELSKDRLSYGLRFGQAEIQQAMNGGGGPNAQTIQFLVLSAGSFTFPGGTPNINAQTQLTSMQLSNIVVPK